MSGVTVAEALLILDPAPSRRTLNRLIATDALAPSGSRQHCGRPAAEYPLADLYRLHASWLRGRADLRQRAS